MFQALALPQSNGRRANVKNVSVETLYGGQFTLSTQLIIPNYPVIPENDCLLMTETDHSKDHWFNQVSC